MVAGDAVADALDRARRLPTLRVGLHLVLVDGRPVSPPDAIPDLVDARGYLRNDMFALGTGIFFDRRIRRQIAAEIDAQFASYGATGLPLDHVNAHHHFHLHPTVAALVLAIGKRYGMRAMRVPLERRRLLSRIEPSASHRALALTAPWAALLRARIRNHVTAPDQVFGLAWSGAMTERRLAGVLRELPNGLTEIYLHPATGAFAGAQRGYRYADELAALTAPAIGELVRASRARTGGFSDFACA
jgi:hopanoid biosynthesis associated protein HpnK